MDSLSTWIDPTLGEKSSRDEIFDALADVQRRRLLLFLLYHDSYYVSELSGVSVEMAEMHQTLFRRYLSGPREVDEADKGLLRTHHIHLPKLAEYGFIDWNREAHVVTKGRRFDEIRPFLEQLDSHRNRLPVKRPFAHPRG